MSVTLEYPVIRSYNNMLLKRDRSVVAYYRIPSTPITVTDEDKKEKHKQVVGQIIKKLGKYKNFDVSLVPRDFLLTEKMRDFSSDLAKDSLALGREVLDRTVFELTREMEIPFQYDWLVGVHITRSIVTESFVENTKQSISDVATGLMERLGYELVINDNWAVPFEDEEEAVYQLFSTLKARRVSNESLFYYQKMQFLRYIPHEKEEVIANRTLENVTDTLITSEHNGVLRLDNIFGTSYVTVLPVGRFSTIFNGFHLAEIVQRMPFQVELKIQAEFMDTQSLLGGLGRSNNRYRNIMNEAHATDTVQQDDILMGAYSVKDMMKRIGNKQEFIEYGAYLVVSASSIESLKRRRQSILSAFQDIKVNIHEATFDAPYLFQALLYGQKLSLTTKKWEHIVTSKGFSEMMLFTSANAGNRVGWYIGRIDNRLTGWDNLQEAIYSSKKIVLFNATVANKEDVAGKVTKNPHMIITGATGEGKSYLAQMIFLLTAQQDVKLLYVDPKQELRKHYESVIQNDEYRAMYPLRVDQIENINFVTLDASNDSNHGVLDPIVVLEKEDASSTAKNILMYLLSKTDTVTLKQTTELTNAISFVLERREAGEQVGFRNVIDVLCESDDTNVQDVGEYFKAIVRGSILELAFSYGDTKGLSYDERVTVLEVANLSLPKDGSEQISDHETNSVAVMFALGAFCKHFGARSDDETMEIFDEAWILMQSSEGKAVIKSMRRVGRSKYNTLCLVTQSVHDAENEEDSTGFGTIFAFKEKSERKDILEHVGLEATEENLNWLDNMLSGQCLYYDVYGNLNMISVHNIHPDIDPLLKPMRETVSSSLENKYAS